jgi:hypothetical protein
MTQDAVAESASKAACTAGKATLTTLLSTNAMLDPRVVATRVMHFCFDESVPPERVERMTPISHGGRSAIGMRFSRSSTIKATSKLTWLTHDRPPVLHGQKNSARHAAQTLAVINVATACFRKGRRREPSAQYSAQPKCSGRSRIFNSNRRG